jgi:ketosteroid isomerase-like protein
MLPVKRPETPEQLHQLFAEAFNARDLDALAALYADGACMCPRIDEPARCGSQLRELLATYCAMNSTMQIATRKVAICGDTALLMSDWRVTGIASDGSAVDASGTSVEVARRGLDGAWRYLIDLPHGVA